jgi:hypothetical protein
MAPGGHWATGPELGKGPGCRERHSGCHGCGVTLVPGGQAGAGVAAGGWLLRESPTVAGFRAGTVRSPRARLRALGPFCRTVRTPADSDAL